MFGPLAPTMAAVEIGLIKLERHGTIGETAWISTGIRIQDSQ